VNAGILGQTPAGTENNSEAFKKVPGQPENAQPDRHFSSMYEPTNAQSATHVLYYQNLRISVTSTTIFSVYSINIRSTIVVLCDEILQHLVHCKNSKKFLKSSSNRDKI
jgi:hypothetical protein